MKIWYSCNLHIDLVIDEMVDHFESAPVLEVTTTSHSCYWCGKRAIYQLKTLPNQTEGEQE